MKDEFTAYQIWKAIHYTHLKDLEEKFGFTSESKFKLGVKGER